MVADHGDRFLERCFTPDERAYAASSVRSSEHLAARFAAKEAVFKSLGVGWGTGVAWTDVEVRRDPTGKPALMLAGGAERAAARLGITHWHLSLTHTTGFAAASVIAIAQL